MASQRRTPIKHTVSTYKKRDGTVVHTFTRGRGSKLNKKYQEKRTMHPSYRDKYKHVDENAIGSYMLYEANVDVRSYPDSPGHIYKYVSSMSGHVYNGVSLNTLKRIARDMKIKHFQIKEYRSDKIVYTTPELDKYLREAEDEEKERKEKFKEDIVKWNAQTPITHKDKFSNDQSETEIYVEKYLAGDSRYARSRRDTFKAYVNIQFKKDGRDAFSTSVRSDDLYSSNGAVMKKRIVDRFQRFFPTLSDNEIVSLLIAKVKDAKDVEKEFN